MWQALNFRAASAGGFKWKSPHHASWTLVSRLLLVVLAGILAVLAMTTPLHGL